MTEKFDEHDVYRVLELAHGHLEDADDVLWQASKRAVDQHHEEILVTLTKQVWDLEHTILDHQQALDYDQTEPES